MKILPKLSRSGNTLLIVMLFTGILTIGLVSYLRLSSGENASVVRSLRWNAALPLAEAGIEEALSQLNKHTNDFSLDGWTQSGTVYSKQRTLGDDYYIVHIDGAPGFIVTITSTGFARLQGTEYVSRTVQVTAQTGLPVPPYGLVARDSISFGGNFLADSYDSSDPRYNTGGLYDPAKVSDQALVATLGIGFSIGGSSHILGSVATGSGGQVITFGNAAVGDLNWRNKGIESGHVTNNFRIDLPDVIAPQSGMKPPSGTVGSTTYTYVLSGGQYTTPTLDAGGSHTTMYVSGKSRLYVPGNINLASVTFAPNASLELIIGASSVSFCPAVYGAAAPQFIVKGLPSCTSIDMTGGTSFIGVIYAPSAALRAAGNSAICGAITSYSFRCLGTFAFHYDLAIGRGTLAKPVTILSWAEP
jgi:hypothetical protein